MSLSLYQEVLHKTRYARWREEDKRRETWDETVARYFDFFEEHLAEKHDYKLTKKERKVYENSVLNMDVMPSMRTFMTAGKALKSAYAANYNCAYLPVDHTRSFSEHMYVLMCGGGSGFSVERRCVDKLPEVPEELHDCDTTIVVDDSRKGWCAGYNQFLTFLYAGNIPKRDTTRLRGEGARLKTFGGYSSGPKVLEDLFDHTIKIFKAAKGRKLRPIEVFSLMTFIAQIVVVGGVRRSATIALFDKDDVEMRRAKSGSWWLENAHYAMANISAVFEAKPEALEFLDIWRDLCASGSGEPGIFNRQAAWAHLEAHGRKTRNKDGSRIMFGINPCSEIILRPYQFCNLTGIAIRPSDTLQSLQQKQCIAATLGTWQSTISDFDYLRKIWRQQVEEERLLGVCLAGIMDHFVTASVNDTSEMWFKTLRDDAIKCNAEEAKAIGINASASVTAVKPAGNSGELYDVASGIHPRYAPYYIRTIRETASSPLSAFLKDNGVPWETSKQNDRDCVFSFPIKSPEGSVFAKDQTAVQQLDHWMHVKENYTTHTISCTVYVRKHEWVTVGAWVYEHFDDITGLSFLPYDDHTYEQAPYQPISKEEYERLATAMPESIDWSLLAHYEQEDTTKVSQEFACTAGACTLS